MNWFIIMVVLAVGPLSVAKNRFEQMETFREIQRLEKIEGQKTAALKLAKQLLEQLDHKDELYQEVAELIGDLGDGNPQFPLDKAIKFATGQKDEVFCKNVGLVYLEGRHNDGTISTVRLISSNRELGGTYSQIKKGDWIYELDTGYRDPVKSESWMDEATDHSYKIREFRRGNNGRFDDGKWSASWDKDDYTNSYSTHGETLEPLPMHLANDYPLWGTFDLGFKIKFHVGYKDKVRDTQRGAPKAIVLKTNREVIEHLPNFNYQDTEMGTHRYSDCFKVRSEIKLDSI